MSTAEPLTESQMDARIKALREHRIAKAAASGSVPAAVRMTPEDIVGVLDKPAAASVSDRVLQAARELYGDSGAARAGEIAERADLDVKQVSNAIVKLKEASRWPYVSLAGRRPGVPSAAKPKPKPRPDLARLDEPRPAPQTAVVEADARPRQPNTFAAMLAVLDAIEALPSDARSALSAYLYARSEACFHFRGGPASESS